jgi:hypothetical protein
MDMTTIKHQLAEARRRIEGLQSQAAAGGLARVRHHCDVLRQQEAAARAAVADEVEEKLGELRTRLDVAEHAVEADAAADWVTFAAAVKAELQSWDTHLERLQTSVAAKAWKTREQAEAAIGDVRSRRIAVEQCLAHARDVASDAWQEQRQRITTARDELAQKAAELSGKLK